MVIMQAYFKPFLFALIFELLRMILEVSLFDRIWGTPRNDGDAKGSAGALSALSVTGIYT